jgi:hypothetical protein
MEKSATRAASAFQNRSSKNPSIVEDEKNAVLANAPIPASLIEWFNLIENGSQGTTQPFASEME